MKFSHINYQVSGSIAEIFFNREKEYNSFIPEVAVEMLHAFEAIAKNKTIRAVHLSAHGNIFCVGGDVAYFAKHSHELSSVVDDSIDIINHLITTMTTLPLPIIASVKGAVAGIGIGFMLACDMVIASEETKFSAAYSNLALCADGGTSYFLSRLLGEKKAMELMLLSTKITAAEALNLGLINRVVPSESLKEETQLLLNKLSEGPKQSYASIKKLVKLAQKSTLEESLAAEKHEMIKCIKNEAFGKSIERFLKKSSS
jgi:2-(1,2-epoxy-1,2-dihydrophenyl)acetyl-CoA isomerase